MAIEPLTPVQVINKGGIFSLRYQDRIIKELASGKNTRIPMNLKPKTCSRRPHHLPPLSLKCFLGVTTTTVLVVGRLL
jgi:hypothetical protein